MLYEIFYLVGASKETDFDSIKKEVEKIITDSEGKFLEKETVEKRRLSYVVNKETHGIYVARRFELEDSSKLEKIIAKLNLDINIARFILSRADELPELKSKEERINDSAKKEEQRKRQATEVTEKALLETKKPIKKEKEIAPDLKEDSNKSQKKEEEKETAKDDDIDKKLEEILNI